MSFQPGSSGGWGGNTMRRDDSPHIAGVVQATSPGAVKHLLAGGTICACSADIIVNNVPADLIQRLEFGVEWKQMTRWVTASLAGAK